MVLFLDDPRVPLSNVHVERQQRRAAIGRRNWLFAGSDEAARRFAILHTLIFNCDLFAAPLFEYLRDVKDLRANIGSIAASYVPNWARVGQPDVRHSARC